MARSLRHSSHHAGSRRREPKKKRKRAVDHEILASPFETPETPNLTIRLSRPGFGTSLTFGCCPPPTKPPHPPFGLMGAPPRMRPSSFGNLHNL